MTQAVLSDDRVSELVAAVQEGRVNASEDAAPRRPRKVRTVDFKRPTKFSPEHVRRLTRAHEGFCAWLSTRFGTEMRLPGEVEIINVVQLTWQNAHGDIPPTAVCGVLEVAETGGPMLLAVELPFALFSIDRMLGGPASFDQRERRLTDIDRVLIRRLFDGLTEGLSAAWTEVADLGLALGPVDAHAGTSATVQSSESVLAITMEIRFGSASTTLTLLVPWITVESAMQRLDAEAAAGPEQLTAGGPGVRTALDDVNIPLTAEVGAVDLPVEQALAIRSGAILRLGVPAADGVVLRAGEVPVAVARPGRSGRHRAVQIFTLLEDG